MQTYTYHHTNLGSYAPRWCADSSGYITVHRSPRYAMADEDQLERWAVSRLSAVRAAVATERAERALERWRNGSR